MHRHLSICKTLLWCKLRSYLDHSIGSDQYNWWVSALATPCFNFLPDCHHSAAQLLDARYSCED